MHGDVKPQNILMFEKDRWTAKVADFSHAILDARHDQRLLGGTLSYSAPEWEKKLSHSGLKKTDIYSYGLVFGSVMAGTDVVRHFLDQKKNGRTMQERTRNLETMKNDGTIKEYIANLIYLADDTDLISRREDIAKMECLLFSLLEINPADRNLCPILSTLAGMISDSQMSSTTHGQSHSNLFEANTPVPDIQNSSVLSPCDQNLVCSNPANIWDWPL